MSDHIYKEIAKNTKGKNILLIGSSGNIGGRALDILIRHGNTLSVTAFDKKGPKIKEFPKNIRILSGNEGDISGEEKSDQPSAPCGAFWLVHMGRR